MARSRVGTKGSSRRRVQRRDQDSDESDEEYKVTDDEDFEESDECYSLDGDESEEISADFGKRRRVSRSRNTRRASSGKKANEVVKPRKKRRVSYTEDDNDDEEFMALDREVNQVTEKKRDSYTDVDDDDDDYGDGGEDYEELVFSGRNRIQREKPREKKRVVYTDDDDDDDDDEAEVADEDDAEIMSLGWKANEIEMPMEMERDTYAEMDDEDDGDDEENEEDEDYDAEFGSSGSKRNQRKKRQERRVVYTEDDEDEQGDDEDDDDEDTHSSRNVHQKKSFRKNRDVSYAKENEDDGIMRSGRKVNQKKNLRRKREVSYTEDDDVYSGRKVIEKKNLRNKREVSYSEEGDDDDVDDEDEDEDAYSGRKVNQKKNLRKKREVSYTEGDDDVDDEDEDEDAYSGRKVNQKKNLRKKREVSYTEEEEEEDFDIDFMHSSRKLNQKKNYQKKRAVSCTEEEEEEEEEEYFDDEDVYLGMKVNQKKNLRKKREVSYTEEEDEDDAGDDDECMHSGRKVNKKKNLQKKREVSHAEEDDDSGFISINKRREKRIVSYKEDNQEEEDENDAEFKLSESDFVDDEDETTKIMNNQITRYHPQKKRFQGGRRKNKKPKTKNPKKPKQRNHRHGQKLGSSKTKSVTNKTRKQRTMAETDSDFVSSASSDHEYTISEEEREQMREARVYCANLRAKLRSSSCGNQEKQATLEQKKYPLRKGKEKIEDMQDDTGKQVCGVCLSEEQKRTIRGVLNCCRHYFCFSCIMEWSKVESRCPLCKQRFTTITKAAKSDTGFDSRTVVIPVPECDQVYQPSEEELRGYLDPYESVICTECQNGGDDALMLLCDICDSSAHTFCVGLGREVPEGNWYCEGCRPTVFGTLSSQHLTPSSDRRLSTNASDLSSSSPIAGGFDLNELYVPETPLAQQTRAHPEPNPGPTATAATTLRDRRRIHRQIHHRFLNNNRMNDLVGRSSGTPGSSSGIRLFGSQLDSSRASVSQNDHIFNSMHDPGTFYSRSDQFSVQVQNADLASADVAGQSEHVALPDFNIGFCTDPPVH